MIHAVTVPSSFDSEVPPQAKPIQAVTERSRTKRRIEQWYPWGLAVLGALVLVCVNPPSKLVYNALANSLGASVGAAAILAGFQGTALTLLFTLLGTEPVAMLKRRNQFKQLVGYHCQAIMAMLLAVAVSVFLLALQGVVTNFGTYSKVIVGAVAFVTLLAGMTSLRVVLLMVRILVHSK